MAASVPVGHARGGLILRDHLARVHKGELIVPESQVVDRRAGMGGGLSISMGDIVVNGGNDPDAAADAAAAKIAGKLKTSAKWRAAFAEASRGAGFR